MKKLYLFLFVVFFTTNIIYAQNYNYPVVSISSANCNNITYQVYVQGAGTGTNRFLCYVLNKPTGDNSYANLYQDANNPVPQPFPCPAPGGYQPFNYMGSDDGGAPAIEIGFTNDYAYITVPTQVGFNSITILGYQRLGISPAVYKRVPPTSCMSGNPNSGWRNVIPQAYAEFHKDGVQTGATVLDPVTYGIANVVPAGSPGYTGMLFSSPIKSSNVVCKGQDLYLYFSDSSSMSSFCGVYGNGFGYVCDMTGTNTATNITGNTIPGQCLLYLPNDIYQSFIKIPGSMLTNTGLTTIKLKSVITGGGYDEVSSNGMNCNVAPAATYNITNYNYTINVVDVPNLSGINSTLVTEPICLGNGTDFVFNSSSLANGTYNITYYLSGSNNGPYVANNVNFNSGTSNINIPAVQLQVAGSTTLEILSVQSTVTGCSTSTTPGTVTDSFVIGTSPDVTGTNSVLVTEPLCLGSNGLVTFNSSSLADGTYNISYSLTGTNTSTQIASGVTVASGTGTFVIPSTVLTNAGSTTISIDGVTNSTTSCTSTIPASTIIDSFVIEIVPNLSGTNSVLVTEPLCLGSNGTVTVNASALANGTYSMAYTLTGTNNTPGAVVVTGVIMSSGTGTFTIPSTSLTNIGTTNISIDFISNEATTCTSYGSGTITDSFLIGSFPNVTGTNSITVTEPLCLGSNGSVSFTSSLVTNGTYNVAYNLTGTNVSSQIANGVVFTSGVGTFTIPAAALSNSGSTTISVSAVTNTTSLCSTAVSAGTISDAFTIGVLPNVTGSNSISVTEPLCLGSNGSVSFSSSLVTNGTYNVAYNLTGANIGNQTATGVVFTSGVGTFTIPAAALSNSGSTTISVSAVTNTTSLCSTAVSAGTISDNFIITTSPNVSGANSVSVTEPLCLGSNGSVSFSSSLVTNGTYNVAYTLTGNNASSQIANSVAFTSGVGTFTIPSAALSNTGTTTITINSIVNVSTLCSSIIPGTISDAFTIGVLPNVTGTNSITVTEPLCLGSNGSVSFSSSLVTNGTYNVAYNLTGTNVSSQIANGVVFTSGVGTFTIPAAALSNSGSTTISVSAVTSTTSLCSTTVSAGTISDAFTIGVLPNVTGTNSITVTEPLCLGSNGSVSFSSSLVTNGTYNVAYNLTGTNVSSQIANGVVFTSGVGTFTIPAAALSNSGSTTISVSAVTSTTSLCSTTVSAGTISDAFTIGVLPNVTGTNSINVTSLICNSDDASVTITSSLLVNGTYNINYTLSGDNNGTYVANNVLFNSSTGTFTIPNGDISNTGTTTITINSISFSANDCSSPLITSLSNVFKTNDGPILSGELTQIFCEGKASTVDDLATNYNNVFWYDSITSNTPLASTTILIDGGTYYGEGIDPLTGCSSEIRLEVFVDYERCDFLIPDGFSPNGDGVNDTYNIVNGDFYYPNYYLEVYDRYGSLIHKGKNWNGTNSGNMLPASVYFVIFYYNDNLKSPSQHRIYLNR